MLLRPKKIKGLRLKCLHCKWEISNKGKCHLTGKGISSCPHKNLHRYNIVVCIPNNPGKRRSKILDTTSFETALAELNNFRQELEKNNYQPKSSVKEKPLYLVDFAVEYLDALSGTNTPDFLMRKRSKEYVDQCRLSIERFIISLKKKNYPINIFRLEELTDTEVGIYHDYLHKLKLGQRSYNKHMGAMKAFVSWAIRVKDQRAVNNVFAHVELKTEHKDCAIITKEEFENLLNIISRDNGNYRDLIRKRDVYKPWLRNGFRTALESGLRREELVTMRWSDIVEVSAGISVIKLNNLKVNRIANGSDTGRFKYVPLTKSLIKLLEELGYSEKRGTDSFILERPEGTNTRYISDTLSRGFAHYIKQVTDRKLEFKCLRKTYITHLTLALGEKSKIFSGHSDDVVLRNHYLSSAFLVGNMSTFSIF
jgi:integrase